MCLGGIAWIVVISFHKVGGKVHLQLLKTGWFLWMVLVDGSCGWILWMVLVDGSCGWFLWMVLVDGSCGWFLWMVLVDGSCGWFLWMLDTQPSEKINDMAPK
jgi:hypothetical protein